MASFVETSAVLPSRARSFLKRDQAMKQVSRISSLTFTHKKRSCFPWQPPMPRLSISCNAKPETLEKVCSIVKKRLALPEHTSVSGESTFSQLGADSLDTVEIVMGLEEEFGITMEEDKAQNIETVQDAADIIEKLVSKIDG